MPLDLIRGKKCLCINCFDKRLGRFVQEELSGLLGIDHESYHVRQAGPVVDLARGEPHLWSMVDDGFNVFGFKALVILGHSTCLRCRLKEGYSDDYHQRVHLREAVVEGARRFPTLPIIGAWQVHGHADQTQITIPELVTPKGEFVQFSDALSQAA